jgi:hypothetical protein
MFRFYLHFKRLDGQGSSQEYQRPLRFATIGTNSSDKPFPCNTINPEISMDYNSGMYTALVYANRDMGSYHKGKGWT